METVIFNQEGIKVIEMECRNWPGEYMYIITDGSIWQVAGIKPKFNIETLHQGLIKYQDELIKQLKQLKK